MRTAYCEGWGQKLLCAAHNFQSTDQGGDTFKVALFAADSDVGPWVESYGEATGELTEGGGYTSGGVAVAVLENPTDNGAGGYTTFENAEWASSNITARYALLYNTSNLFAVIFFDFGEVKQTNGGNFIVEMPPRRPDTALIRVTAPGGA